MANTSIVNGFKPVKYLNGSPWNGACRKYFVEQGEGAGIWVGDLVVPSNSAAEGGWFAVEQAAAAATNVIGVVVGVEVYTPTSGSVTLDTPLYVPATKSRDYFVYVADDPELICEVQEDAVGGALAAASVGLNADFIVGSGSTTTGLSGMQLDTSTATTTNTLPLKIMGFVQRDDNEIGSANAKVLVMFNTHAFKAATGSLGV